MSGLVRGKNGVLMVARVCGVALLGMVCAGAVMAQDAAGLYSRKNTWTVFAEYSNTSSHILQGDARQRVLADLGFGYARRLLRFWGSDLDYQAELRPAMFESDPVSIEADTTTTYYPPPDGTITSTRTGASPSFYVCQPSFVSGSIPAGAGFPAFDYANRITCGRRWTAVQAFSPAGVKFSMRTRHALQPFVIGTMGYMYSSRAIPLNYETGGTFNVQYDFGVGVELFRSDRQKSSVALECRFHHFADWTMPSDLGGPNTGVDNLTYKVSYSFGK